MRQSEWWARIFDELIFQYISGARGHNTDYTFPTTYTGFATNAFVAPDAQHRLFGGNATSSADVDSADVMDVSLLERSVVKASTMGGGTTRIPAIEPIRINGEEHYVVVMHPFQQHSLRTNTSTGQWLDIAKAAAGAEGRDSPIFKGAYIH